MDILKKEICFLSKDKMYCNKNDKSYTKELILSPYYYWYFEKKLPVSNMKRAKAIISQMLETSLPINKNFTYVLRLKEKNIFDVFVVDSDLLISKLNTLGIEKEKISSISFSHLELDDCYIKLDDSEIFSYQNIVSEITQKDTVTSNLLNIDINDFLEKKTKLLFKHNFSRGNFLQKTIEFCDMNFSVITGIFLLFLSSLVIDIVSAQNTINNYVEGKESVLKKQTYATHSVQLKYVMDEVLKIDFKQKKLKTTYNNLLKMNTNKNNFIQKLEYDDGDWFVDILAQNQNNANSLIKNKKFTFVRSDKNIFKYEKVK